MLFLHPGASMSQTITLIKDKI
ncbi:GDP-mannose pyrophosphatase NudK, partial [Salmonella enterica subsp. enterica serovar Poona]|nr:GDP-mannose pyrophosphatase NudK [Salmonella enterica]EDA8500547.1 GDP-mannose pyrophosphatase NudK [Salmonella enterica subsp. enterica serovar Poona]EDC2225982.1 GDP-mannose pyrophosphatase NudK [Salmonella enterica]